MSIAQGTAVNIKCVESMLLKALDDVSLITKNFLYVNAATITNT